MDDPRVHLAPAHLGRLRQGQLKTLCGRLAVTELSPFAAATPNRCRTCYSKVDDEGMLDAEVAEASDKEEAREEEMNLAALSPEVRTAAERFELETGRSLDANLGPGPVDERMIELFLILNGYAPRDVASVRSTGDE